MCQRLEIRLDNGGEGGDEGKKQGGGRRIYWGRGGVVCVAGFIKHLQHFRLLTVVQPGDRQTQVKKSSVTGTVFEIKLRMPLSIFRSFYTDGHGDR